MTNKLLSLSQKSSSVSKIDLIKRITFICFKQFTWICLNAQLVLLTFVCHWKHVVIGVNSVAVKIFQIDPKFALGFRQAVFFLIRAKTRLQGYQSHSCSQTTCGRNPQCHPASFGPLSIHRRQFLGHKTLQSQVQHHLGWFCKHHWLFCRIWTARHSSYALIKMN